jgi:hypothetical protein
MDEHRSGQREKWLIPTRVENSEGRIQYLLNAEEKILQSIYASSWNPK